MEKTPILGGKKLEKEHTYIYIYIRMFFLVLLVYICICIYRSVGIYRIGIANAAHA